MTGNYPLSVEIIADTIKTFEENKKLKEIELREMNLQYNNMQIENKDFDDIYKMIPTWEKVFNDTDKATKRVLINKIVDKIIITKENITIKFKINLEECIQPRISEHHDTTKHILIRGYKNIILNDFVIKNYDET
jgi:hypothetical protein